MEYVRNLGKKRGTPPKAPSPAAAAVPSPDPFLLSLFQQQLGFVMRPELFLLNNVDSDSVTAR